MSLSLEAEQMEHTRLEKDDYSDGELEEQDEEALSLCDLPVGNEDQKTEENRTGHGDDFDFGFGSVIGSVTGSESEMCAADEVFSGGQMLPLRHSLSSATELGLPMLPIPKRCVSRSESMDHVSLGSRSSSSSRSSSTRSHHSTTSSSTSTSSSSSFNSFNNASYTLKTMGLSKSKPKGWNQFHSYPSPKPQIRASGARLSTSTMPTATNATMWQVLKLGLVRTPEIELQGNRSNRTSNTRFIIRNDSVNSSRSSNSEKKSSESVTSSSCKISNLWLEMRRWNNQLLYDRKSGVGGGIFKSCKCSVGAIEPVPVVGVRRDDCKTGIGGQNVSLPPHQGLEEDKKLGQKEKEQSRCNYKQLRQGKQAMSNHRTFEWLRDLSHASLLNA